MKKFILALMLFVLVFSFGASATISESRAKKYHDAVGLLWSLNTSGYVFRCTATAFQYTKDGYLFVTAGHCVHGKPEAIPLVMTQEIIEGKKYKVKVLAEGNESENYDFAVLLVSAPKETFTTVKFGHNPWYVGEKLYSFSAPAGVGRLYLEGNVSDLDFQNKTLVVDGMPVKHTWEHNIGIAMLGLEPGSSGSSIMCVKQNKVCMLFIGIVNINRIPAAMIAEPIQKFTWWWKQQPAYVGGK